MEQIQVCPAHLVGVGDWVFLWLQGIKGSHGVRYYRAMLVTIKFVTTMSMQCQFAHSCQVS